MKKHRNPYAVEAYNRKGGSHETSKKDSPPCKICHGHQEIISKAGTEPCPACAGYDL